MQGRFSLPRREARLRSRDSRRSHCGDEFANQSGSRALVSLPLRGATRATFLYLKRAAVEDWHRAPRRMFLIAVQGMSEVTAGDGSATLRTRQHRSDGRPDRQGHITRAVGNVDHIALTSRNRSSCGRAAAAEQESAEGRRAQTAALDPCSRGRTRRQTDWRIPSPEIYCAGGTGRATSVHTAFTLPAAVVRLHQITGGFTGTGSVGVRVI